MTDEDNEMMRDLSEVFKVSTENLNTETSIEVADKAFVRLMRASEVFMTKIFDFVKSLKESEEKKA